MHSDPPSPKRRQLLGALGAGLLLGRGLAVAMPGTRLSKPIPSSGERLPIIGMGSWITFDVGDYPDARARRVQVLQAFFDDGGGLIDSSPMYGSSEAVIGHCLQQVTHTRNLFAATKVWTWGRKSGMRQMERSRALWGVPRFDLMQIHNMLDWQTHLETLKAWKSEGRIRYIGITTSHGRRHAELEQALRDESFDFVQMTYNIHDREAESRLLPLAAERGIAVIANRPFAGGSLFDAVRGRAVPAFAAEIGCENWAQFFLKFAVSHPAVTCAIPATTSVQHMRENMGAGYGVLPDAGQRGKMAEVWKAL